MKKNTTYRYLLAVAAATSFGCADAYSLPSLAPLLKFFGVSYYNQEKATIGVYAAVGGCVAGSLLATVITRHYCAKNNAQKIVKALEDAQRAHTAEIGAAEERGRGAILQNATPIIQDLQKQLAELKADTATKIGELTMENGRLQKLLLQQDQQSQAATGTPAAARSLFSLRGDFAASTSSNTQSGSSAKPMTAKDIIAQHSRR